MKSFRPIVQLALFLLLLSCSEDKEKNPDTFELTYNGKSLKLVKLRVVHSVYDWNSQEIVEFFGKFDSGDVLLMQIVEYANPLSPRIFPAGPGQTPKDPNDCVVHGVYKECDYFSLYLSGPVGPGAIGAVYESYWLELNQFDSESKKIAGTFRITGKKVDADFVIKGEFETRYAER